MSAADLAAIREVLKVLPHSFDCPAYDLRLPDVRPAEVCSCRRAAAFVALDRIEQNALTPEEAQAIYDAPNLIVPFTKREKEAYERGLAKLERIAGDTGEAT